MAHAHHHHDGHDHDHGHGHDSHDDRHDHHGHAHHSHHHHHAGVTQGRAFLVAIALNSAFVVVEFAYGLMASSTALVADAGHNLSDVLGLVLAWGAAMLSKRAPAGRYTYGLRSSSILAALVNAVLLLVACGAIALEAAQRIANPPQVAGLTVVIVAGIGILVNGLSALLFASGRKEDLNVRGAYLHMAADAAVSLGVVIVGIAVIYTGWNWLDPVVSLAIVAVIVYGTWSLLRESVQLALNAVPQHVDVGAVETYLRQRTGVADVHDLHIWAMSTTECALTVHLVLPSGHPGDAFLDEICCELKDRFRIHHSTLQVEQGTTTHACELRA
jgi:cobalt-zinc-cadmium efflux system protein